MEICERFVQGRKGVFKCLFPYRSSPPVWDGRHAIWVTVGSAETGRLVGVNAARETLQIPPFQAPCRLPAPNCTPQRSLQAVTFGCDHWFNCRNGHRNFPSKIQQAWLRNVVHVPASCGQFAQSSFSLCPHILLFPSPLQRCCCLVVAAWWCLIRLLSHRTFKP